PLLLVDDASLHLAKAAEDVAEVIFRATTKVSISSSCPSRPRIHQQCHSRYTTHKEGAAVHLDASLGQRVVVLDPFFLLERLSARALAAAPTGGSLPVVGHVPAATIAVPVIRTPVSRRAPAIPAGRGPRPRTAAGPVWRPRAVLITTPVT